MLIYKDIISGDEIISDSYHLKEVDGVVYEVDCAMIKSAPVSDIDIGANMSAEETGGELDDRGVWLNNVVQSFCLVPTSFDKWGYLAYLKGYLKVIREYLQDSQMSEEELEDFETNAQAFASKVAANFKAWEFYTGKSMDMTGMVVLLNYREDGVTPYIVVWKHGLEATMA